MDTVDESSKGSIQAIMELQEEMNNVGSDMVARSSKYYSNKLVKAAEEAEEALGLTQGQALQLADTFRLLKDGKLTPDSFQNTIDDMIHMNVVTAEFASKIRTSSDSWGDHKTALDEIQALLDGLKTPEFEIDEPKGGKKPDPRTIAGLTPFQAEPWQIGVPDEKLVEEWFTRVAATRNETLRREYLASKDEPWMIGLVDPETLQTALDDMDTRLQDQHDKQMERLREQASAGFQTAGAVAGYFEQLASNKQNALAEEVANSKNMSEAEIKNREKAAEKAFEAEKKWALAGVAMNTGVAAMKALATEDPFTKWASFAAVLATGATQAAAIEGRTFNSGAFNPSSASTSQPISNTTNNQSITNNVTVQGGVGFGIAELQELFDNDNVIIDPSSAQGRALMNG
jgi:hypothetical protein